MHLEYKYLIPFSVYLKIKNEMLPYLVPDKNALNKINNDYTVRSLYFDSPHLKYYFEKIEGIKIRKKIRIRVYDDYTEEKKAFLEIKRKNEGYVYKERAQLYFKNVDEFLDKGKAEDFIICPQSDGKAIGYAKTFFYYLIQENLHPTILVTYEREPYYYKFGNDLRITFDKNLRYLSFTNHHKIFEEKKLKPALNNKVIIEIKFSRTFPVWLKNIISRYGLQRQALSKYTICLQADKNIDLKRVYKKILITNSGSPQYSNN